MKRTALLFSIIAAILFSSCVSKKQNEEAIMFVFNKDVEDFTMDNYFYIEKDIYASKSITDELGKNSIMFVKGKYNIVYDETTKYYYALVETILK